MGWSIPTYDGIAAHGRPSNLRLAMFELIRGIDERVEAYSGAPSSYGWWTASSSSQLAPTFDDLEFLKCTGNKTGGTTANANRAYRNMELIRDRIRTQLSLGRFFTASGGDTAYTIASMETAIGRGLDLPESVTEASWWQAMQDALDRMIYLRKALLPDGSENAVFSSDYTDVGPGDDLADDWEIIWDSREENSTTGSTSVFWKSLQEYYSPTPATYYMQVELVPSASLIFATTGLAGDVVTSKLIYNSLWNKIINPGVHLYPAAPVDISINAESISVSSAASNLELELTGVGTGSDFVVDMAMPSTPSDNPIVYVFGGGNRSGIAGINVTALHVYFDISSALTDQA